MKGINMGLLSLDQIDGLAVYQKQHMKRGNLDDFFSPFATEEVCTAETIIHVYFQKPFFQLLSRNPTSLLLCISFMSLSRLHL